MAVWRSDDDLFAAIRSDLFTAVIGDVMDTANLRHQFLPPQLKPLHDAMIVLGRAMPVLEADCGDTIVAHANKRQPFGLMFDALDDLEKNEVYICTGASPRYALWGELMSERAISLGAAGAIVDGYSRDTRGILRLGFSTFSWGRYAQDQGVRGRVIDFRCGIEFGNGVVVKPGDILFGDLDGVVVIPSEHANDVVNQALEKVHGENKVRDAIRGGMTAREAFDTYGIM